MIILREPPSVRAPYFFLYALLRHLGRSLGTVPLRRGETIRRPLTGEIVSAVRLLPTCAHSDRVTVIANLSAIGENWERTALVT